MTKRSHFFASVFTLALIDIFLVHDMHWLARHGTGMRFYVNLAVSIVFLGSWIWFARATFLRRCGRSGWMLFSLLTCVPALAQLAHFKVYNDVIHPNGFDFAAKNTMETISYFVDLASVPRMLGAVCGFLFSLWLLARSIESGGEWQGSRRGRILSLAGTALSALLVGLLIPAGAYNWYSVSLYQNSVFAFYGTLAESASIRFGAYTVDKPPVPASRLSTKGLPNVLWIVGESAVKSHMSVYGYERDTTPRLQGLLERGELLRFTNMLAVGNKTMLSLPYMLFGLEGPDPKGRIYRHPSIFNYAKARGLRTGFVSAQDIRWYRFDKLVVDKSLDVVLAGPEFSSNVTVRNGADDLKVIRQGVLPFVREAKDPFFLVYQMNGNHYPYADHSPHEEKIFLPEREPNSRNAYDNSMLYTDKALGELIETVRREKPDTWIFFASDHGQSVADDGGTKFHSGYADDVIFIPFFVMPPPGTSKATLHALRANTNGPLSQSDIFATVVDILGVEPIRPYDGLSLRKVVPSERVRFCSEFMPTFSNNPNAAYVDGQARIFKLDFNRMQVFDADDKLLSRIKDLDKNVLRVLDQRL